MNDLSASLPPHIDPQQRVIAAIVFALTFLLSAFLLLQWSPPLDQSLSSSFASALAPSLPPPPPTPRPLTITESICGSGWQEQYAHLHRRILSGDAPPRYLISVAIAAGVADRLVGLASEFYAALFSGRALQMVSFGMLPGFDAAYDAPNIEWLRRDQPPPEVVEYLDVRHPLQTKRTIPESLNLSTYWPLYVVNNNPAHDAIFLNTDMRNFPEGHQNVPYVFMASNRGLTYRMFNNTHDHEQLNAMGLTPSTAFFCAMDLLFRPNAAVLSQFANETMALSDPTVALRIGIHVRAGDRVFGKDAQVDMDAVAGGFFACAEGIEREATLDPGQKVVWYLISDSLSLRQQAKLRYGDKLVTDTTTANVHSDCKYHNPAQCSEEAMKKAMQEAAGQLMVFALADVHIISTRSGFGKVGVWLSPHKHKTYAAYVNQQGRACEAYSDQAMANTWSGI